MRSATISLLLCTIVLMHNVAGQIVGQKWWVTVPAWSSNTVLSARMLVWGLLGLPRFSYILHMDWAQGAWWNADIGRYTRYRAYFRIHLNNAPFTWFRCRAWSAFPEVGPPFFVGGIGGVYNTCERM